MELAIKNVIFLVVLIGMVSNYKKELINQCAMSFFSQYKIRVKFICRILGGCVQKGKLAY